MEQLGASCSRDWGHQQVSIKGTVSRAGGEQMEQRGASCSGDWGHQQVSIKGTVSREDGEQVEQQESGNRGISRLALKGLCHQRMGNRSSKKKVETGASAGKH
jgi:uncharacterized protein YutD